MKLTYSGPNHFQVIWMDIKFNPGICDQIKSTIDELWDYHIISVH